MSTTPAAVLAANTFIPASKHQYTHSTASCEEESGDILMNTKIVPLSVLEPSGLLGA